MPKNPPDRRACLIREFGYGPGCPVAVKGKELFWSVTVPLIASPVTVASNVIF